MKSVTLTAPLSEGAKQHQAGAVLPLDDRLALRLVNRGRATLTTRADALALPAPVQIETPTLAASDDRRE